jgi:hypothetical protein
MTKISSRERQGKTLSRISPTSHWKANRVREIQISLRKRRDHDGRKAFLPQIVVNYLLSLLRNDLIVVLVAGHGLSVMQAKSENMTPINLRAPPHLSC